MTREGYGLDGWSDGTVRYDSTKTITTDVTVTAQWIAGAASYKVEHYMQDTAGDYPAAPDYTDTKSGIAEAAIDPETLKRDDTGFAYDKSDQESYTIDGDGSTVVKLYYTRNKHTLTWDLGAGTAPDGYTQGEVYFDAPVTAPAVTKTGYTCVWDSTPPVTMPDEDVTLTASWTPITYTVKFDLNGGSMAEGVEPLEDVTIKYDETFTLPASGDITREHYDIKGWSKDKNSTEADFEPSASLSNLTTEDDAVVTLYALWTPMEYHFDFYHNGGTIEDGNVSDQYYRYDYTIEDIQAGPIQLPTPTREKYDFLGWYENEDFSGNPVTEIPVTATGDASYYAKWEQSKVLMTYTLLPSLDNGVNTRVSALLAADAEELPAELVPGADLPTPQLADGLFVCWCTDLNQPIESKVTKVPEDAEGDCQVYLVYAPYTLRTKKDLLGFRYACWDSETSDVTTKKTFTLGSDITLDATWNDIADTAGTNKSACFPYFKGTFNGAGHTITYDGANTPLFNQMGRLAVVQNLNIKIAQDIVAEWKGTGRIRFGLVARSLTSLNTIENVHIGGGTIRLAIQYEGGIITGTYFGGISGEEEGGNNTIVNCTVGDPGNPLNLVVTGDISDYILNIGGVVGRLNMSSWIRYDGSLSSERRQIYVTISLPEDFELSEPQLGGAFYVYIGGVVGFYGADKLTTSGMFKSGNYDIYVRLPEISGHPELTGTIVGSMQVDNSDYLIASEGATVKAHSNIEAEYGRYCNRLTGVEIEGFTETTGYSHTTVGTPAAPGGT